MSTELQRVHERLDDLMCSQERTHTLVEKLTERVSEVCAVVIHDPQGNRKSLLSRVDALEASQPRSLPPAARHASRAAIIAAVIGAAGAIAAVVLVALLT